jgi:hypothetical protein
MPSIPMPGLLGLIRRMGMRLLQTLAVRPSRCPVSPFPVARASLCPPPPPHWPVSRHGIPMLGILMPSIPMPGLPGLIRRMGMRLLQIPLRSGRPHTLFSIDHLRTCRHGIPMPGLPGLIRRMGMRLLQIPLRSGRPHTLFSIDHLRTCRHGIPMPGFLFPCSEGIPMPGLPGLIHRIGMRLLQTLAVRPSLYSTSPAPYACLEMSKGNTPSLPPAAFISLPSSIGSPAKILRMKTML